MHVELVPFPNLTPFVALDGQNSGPVVFTGKILRPFGAVYLSRPLLRDSSRLFPDLVEELAGEIGWVSQAEHDEAVHGRDAKIAELEGRLAELEPVERALLRAVAEHGEPEPDRPVRQRGPRRREAA